jgi:Kdo2-lipid IVA lauroyltransferase/acyltransferase
MHRRPKSRWRRATEQFFVHWLMAGLSVLLRRWSLPALRRLAVGGARVLGVCVWRRQAMMERNLIAVFGDSLTAADRSRIRWGSIYNIAKTMVETLKLQWMTPDELRAAVSVASTEAIDAALARGRGVIIITAHYGNWEYAGASLALLGYPVNVIARDANDPLTRDLTNHARESMGVRVFGRWDARPLLKALKSNEVVAILPDQHAKDAPVRGTFLGLPADTATGPATFAMRTGATIIPGFAVRGPDDHIEMQVHPPLELVDTGDRDADVATNTQLINDVISAQIRALPDQWLWLHNRWKVPTEGAGDA